jgi:hypothetical protein
MGLGSAHAAVQSGTASGTDSGGNPVAIGFQILSIPFSESNPDSTVGDDNFQSNTFYAFDEVQNQLNNAFGGVLMSALDAQDSAGNAIQIASGTAVESSFVVFDPLDLIYGSATIVFDSDILGVITTTAGLMASQALLGDDRVTYNYPSLSGLEVADNYSYAGNVLTLDLSTLTPGDALRVITAGETPDPIPLPGAAVLFLTALGGGLFARARRARA